MNETGDGWDAVRARLDGLVQLTRQRAEGLHVVFVTNLRSEPLADLGPEGVLNLAQYYTAAQADTVIRTLQSSGLTVESFFDEASFLRAALDGEVGSPGRTTIVYTAAEGGSGIGRRALVPAFCNLVGLPVLNSKAHASSTARHKHHSQAILAHEGIRSPRTWLFNESGWLLDHRPPPGLRVIIKPTFESDAIGVGHDSVVVADERLDQVVARKQRLFGQAATVQEYVPGDEISVALVRDGETLALPIVETCRRDGSSFGDGFKTFESESIDHDQSYHAYHCSPDVMADCHQLAVAAFDVLGMSGVGRMDFRVDVDGRPWLFDASESPPPLEHSAFGHAVHQLGFSVVDMLAIWVGACLVEYDLTG